MRKLKKGKWYIVELTDLIHPVIHKNHFNSKELAAMAALEFLGDKPFEIVKGKKAKKLSIPVLKTLKFKVNKYRYPDKYADSQEKKNLRTKLRRWQRKKKNPRALKKYLRF